MINTALWYEEVYTVYQKTKNYVYMTYTDDDIYCAEFGVVIYTDSTQYCLVQNVVFRSSGLM